MSCISQRIFVAIATLVACSCPAMADGGTDWNPKKTWVFAVGLLEWQRPEMWPSFPAAMKNRRDQQFVQHFREAGVPEKQIVYLADVHATKQRVVKSFTDFLSKPAEDDLLVFYFCGHGSRNRKSGQAWFINYDADGANDSAWSVQSIFDALENHFNGSRVLMLADCCHSGALYDHVRKLRDSEIAYAAITSSYSHNPSTGHWTFTDSVLAGLRGDARVDLNEDQVVELREIARYCELDLAFIEGQKSMFTASKGFSQNAKITAARGKLKPRVGQRVEVEYKGKWYKAKTIDANGEKLKVHYANYEDSWDEWVGPERVRPYQPVQFAEGDKIQVQWSADKKWYPATVEQAWYGLHLVRYDGYDLSTDEWVGPRAVRLRGN